MRTLIAIYREGLKPQISSTLAAVMLYSLSVAIQVATEIEEDMLARSSHKVAAQNNRQGDKLNAENSHNGAAENSQSYPTRPEGQFSLTSEEGQGNQKWQRQPNGNSNERHYCGQTGHLMAFCPNKQNRLAAPAKQVVFLNAEEEIEDEKLERVDEECYEPWYLVRCNDWKDDEEDNDWKRNNIFQTRVRCNGQLCNMVIDSGSCSTAISKNVVQKLGLETKLHPNPYKVAGVNNTSLKESRPFSRAKNEGLKSSSAAYSQTKIPSTLSCIRFSFIS
ncbi:hypothetical protein M9H77_33944 [Catharanthus roseus]|uniref:Uncharacterized protein n=1 Tax=Catharanthus roseus TaxID=4058 RepID=A0ACB9ZLH2_CATRO|nr:hypothetical protein M9H77_33944 [Catharanthus roseus]